MKMADQSVAVIVHMPNHFVAAFNLTKCHKQTSAETQANIEAYV